MSKFTGVPSDDLDEVLAVGGTDVTTMLVSMSARDPGGRDADYIEWHSLDHRPELHRLPALRGALRFVSTPACRAARAVNDERYDEVDHVMTYLFADRAALGPFTALGAALAGNGRVPLRLPTVELGAYELAGEVAARRVKAGADVIPWRPARGAYLLVEQGGAPAGDLAEVPGVAGVWWYGGIAAQPLLPADSTGMQITCCYLDDDPAETGARLSDVVARRWAGDGPVPLLAAPFHAIVPFEWDRHLP